MINLFQFGVLRVHVVEQASSINVAELVINMPCFQSKRNNGYGDNIGDGQVVPSSGFTFDPDLIDLPVGAPSLPPFGPPL